MRNLLIPALFTLLASTAHAGRPFVTEDAGLLDRGACEWESTLAHATERAAQAGNAWSNQVGCGVGGRTQMALGTTHARSAGVGSNDLTLGGKVGLVDGGDAHASVALAGGSTWVRAPGAAQRWDNAAATLVVSVPLHARWTGHANLGVLHLRDDRDTLGTWALALEHALKEQLAVGVETFGPGRGKPWIGAGVRWQVAPAVTLYASVARQAGTARARTVTAGLKLAF